MVEFGLYPNPIRRLRVLSSPILSHLKVLNPTLLDSTRRKINFFQKIYNSIIPNFTHINKTENKKLSSNQNNKKIQS